MPGRIVLVCCTAGAATMTPGFHAMAAEAPPGGDAVRASAKPMGMNEPMPIKMKKPGMVKGDVKKAADKKAGEMKPMLERERQAMPGAAGKP